MCRGRSRRVRSEGALSKGENERGQSQRGRRRGRGLLPPPPLPKAEFIDPVFMKKRHRTINFNHKDLTKISPMPRLLILE